MITSDPFMAACRQAFRRLHRLPADPPTSDPGIRIETRLAAARHHRMLGLLCAGADPSTPLPPVWRQAAYGQTLHTTRCTAEAERLFALLDASLPQILLIKGPGLAHQAWPDPGLRAFDDLDFRCPRAAYTDLCRLLQQAGYQPQPADTRRHAHLWHYGWGVAFLHPEGSRIEVNHRAFPPHFPWPSGLELAAPGHTVMQPLDTAPVRIPEPALHLLLTCMHALWHGGERLAWIVDIAGLLVRHPNAFNQAAALAGRCAFARCALHTGTAIATEVFGAELSPQPLPAAHDAVARTYRRQLSQGASLTFAEQTRLHQAMLRPLERIASLVKRATIPGDRDFMRLSLPPSLRPLYRLYRPLRLLYRG